MHCLIAQYAGIAQRLICTVQNACSSGLLTLPLDHPALLIRSTHQSHQRTNSPVSPAHQSPVNEDLKDAARVFQVFELSRHLKQSGLDSKENVPWDGGHSNPAVLEVVRHLVHQIHIITHEAHRLEGMFLPLQLGPVCFVSLNYSQVGSSIQVLCVAAMHAIVTASFHNVESEH